MKSFKTFLYEMGAGAIGGGSAGPTNTVGSGSIAGAGQPPGSKSGEPGVDLRKRKKHNPVLMPAYRMHRNPPK